jgi:hypothetical protein
LSLIVKANKQFHHSCRCFLVFGTLLLSAASIELPYDPQAKYSRKDVTKWTDSIFKSIIKSITTLYLYRNSHYTCKLTGKEGAVELFGERK